MATPDEEIQYLKENNNELVKKVQLWMMTAGQRENEKLALMKENNELRLKLSILKSSGGALATNLDATIQKCSEKAISQLVKASTEIAHMTEVAKAYMRDLQQLETTSPRWSTLSGSPIAEKKDRVHRVPPMMMGGQSIQPVVALSRTLLNTSNPRSESRSINPTRSAAIRAVPVHMLQDVYIPLTRIDVTNRQTGNTNSEPGIDNESAESSNEDSDFEDCIEDRVVDENMSEDEDYQQSRLDPVLEDVEPEDEVTPPRIGTENPLEGPSWLLDRSANDTPTKGCNRPTNFEPDSTTGIDEMPCESSPIIPAGRRNSEQHEEEVVALHVFTPTVRRRKRVHLSPITPELSPRLPHSPIFSPPRPASARRNSISGRVLKVLVAKMRLAESVGEDVDVTPPKRSAQGSHTSGSPLPSPRDAVGVAGGSAGSAPLARFDAPSPNGTTDARVIVLETKRERDSIDHRANNSPEELMSNGGGDMWRNVSRRVKQETSGRKSRARSYTSSDSDSTVEWPSEGRTRRNRKPVTYAEKPLNRKMRR